jgi:hypothetical protein
MDKPVEVALGRESGVLKEGRYGEYWTYFLEDSRVMYVPPSVHDQIDRLGISAGQKFLVSKSADETAPRGLKWFVALPGQPETQADAVLTTETTQAPDEPKAVEATQTNGGATPQAVAPVECAEPQQKVNGGVVKEGLAKEGSAEPNGHAPVNGAVKPNGKAPAVEAGKAGVEPAKAAGVEVDVSPLLKSALRAAVDAVIDAEKYAAGRSYNVRFTSEDVRAAAISIFIAAREGVRR